MTKNILIIFLLSNLNSPASNLISDRDSSGGKSFTIASDYYYASDAITNKFALTFYKNEFIDDALKNSVSENLSSQNHFGIGLKGEIKYYSGNKTIFNLSNSFFSVSINNRFHVNCSFKNDAFEIFFRGNKSYAGKTAMLGEFNYEQLLYQQINFTFGHIYKINENVFGYSGGISFNKGQKLYTITANRASLYTQSRGEYIDLDAGMEIYQSDSSNNGLSAWNGTGASTDFSFYWLDKKSNKLNLSINNFGFINWNDQTAYIKVDTSFRFTGVDATELFQFSDSVHETISLDSSLVEPYLTVREKKSHRTVLPSQLSLSYQYIITPERFNIEGTLDYLFFAESTIHESVTFTYLINNLNSISLITSNGGYTGFNLGLAFKTRFLKSFLLSVQSDYISSMLNQNNGQAQGAFVSLTTYF